MVSAAVREELGIPVDAIYPSDMLGLTYLDASNKGIVYLEGLEHAVNMTRLCLSINQISDISAISGLMNLTDLVLWHNQISDISAVSGLENLICLDLSYNYISDISSLANLTNLARLSLDSNQISDISPLVGNVGLSAGDFAYLDENPLSSDSRDIHIPELEARGVIVTYSDSND